MYDVVGRRLYGALCEEDVVALRRAFVLCVGGGDEDVGGVDYALSPRMRRASCMSLGMMVTLLAWMAQRLVSSKSPTR